MYCEDHIWFTYPTKLLHISTLEDGTLVKVIIVPLKGCEKGSLLTSESGHFIDLQLDLLFVNTCESIIPSHAQYVTLQKYFSPPTLVIYLFATPHMKLIWDCNLRQGTTNSKPPGPIIKIGQSETGRSSQIILITFSSRFTAVMNLLPGLAFVANMLGQNHFLEPYWHVLTFLHPILIVTAGMLLVHLHQSSVCDLAKLFLTF